MRLAAKRIASLTCAAALLLSMSACTSAAASGSGSTTDSSISANAPDGQPPEKPDGAPGDGKGGPGGGFGGFGQVMQGTSANTLDSDTTVFSTSYSSTGSDENALRVDGADVTLRDVTVTKSDGKSSNTEDGDFYGMNAALLATNGATLTVTDSTIRTSADNSGGIQTTGGGTTNASDLTVETAGNSSAAIRSDRGGGTVNVTGGSYSTSGYNSPAVYSTANISVSDADLTAANSEALVIEGSNSIALTNCTVSGNMSSTQSTSADENVHSVMLYQSMSGDAEVGTSCLSITGGSLTGKSGDLFYITNTHAIISLSGVTLSNEDASASLMTIAGNSASHGWGTAGRNGAQVEFTADAQTLNGNITVDSISTLNFVLINGSVFTGTINIVDNAEGGKAVSDNAAVTIDSSSTWELTGDCTLSTLENNGAIHFNGHTITLADGTVLK